jgi:hypothetical protein
VSIVRYCPIFNQIWSSSADLLESPRYQISRKSVNGIRTNTYGRTDRNEEANRHFSLFFRRNLKISVSSRIVFVFRTKVGTKGDKSFKKGKFTIELS